jgi:hypothetical protein
MSIIWDPKRLTIEHTSIAGLKLQARDLGISNVHYTIDYVDYWTNLIKLHYLYNHYVDDLKKLSHGQLINEEGYNLWDYSLNKSELIIRLLKFRLSSREFENDSLRLLCSTLNIVGTSGKNKGDLIEILIFSKIGRGSYGICRQNENIIHVVYPKALGTVNIIYRLTKKDLKDLEGKSMKINKTIVCFRIDLISYGTNNKKKLWPIDIRYANDLILSIQRHWRGYRYRKHIHCNDTFKACDVNKIQSLIRGRNIRKKINFTSQYRDFKLKYHHIPLNTPINFIGSHEDKNNNSYNITIRLTLKPWLPLNSIFDGSIEINKNNRRIIYISRIYPRNCRVNILNYDLDLFYNQLKIHISYLTIGIKIFHKDHFSFNVIFSDRYKNYMYFIKNYNKKSFIRNIDSVKQLINVNDIKDNYCFTNFKLLKEICNVKVFFYDIFDSLTYTIDTNRLDKEELSHSKLRLSFVLLSICKILVSDEYDITTDIIIKIREHLLVNPRLWHKGFKKNEKLNAIKYRQEMFQNKWNPIENIGKQYSRKELQFLLQMQYEK